MADIRCGDPTRIRQVLLNLVSNAIKFTENGRLIVTAKSNSPNLTVAKVAETPSIVLVVQDTGIGISAESQEKLFQPFVQADSVSRA